MDGLMIGMLMLEPSQRIISMLLLLWDVTNLWLGSLGSMAARIHQEEGKGGNFSKTYHHLG